MKLLWLVVVGGVLANTSAGSAQTVTGNLQTEGGVRTAVFRTPQGGVTVHVAADAAPGDTLSGVVLPEPSGATPEEQQKNMGVLSGLVVEMQTQEKTSPQETPVSSRRYRWIVPVALRTGAATLILRDAARREVSRLTLPVEPTPAPPVDAGRTAAGNTLDLPREAQPGRPAVIRGTFDGSLEGKTVSVQDRPAQILAASPRQVVFRVPTENTGPVTVEYRSTAGGARGTMRVMGVRLTATSTQLLRGQTATLTLTATGLQGITQPATMTLTNGSAAIVNVQGGNVQTFTIEPRQVQADGTYSMTRRLTGIMPGGFLISALVSSPPMAQFDQPRATAEAMTSWEASTGVRIAPDAHEAISRSIDEARRPLEQYLRAQQAHQADVRSVYDALVRHYCFDLRDEMLQRTPVRAAAFSRSPVMLSARTQAGAAQAQPEITTQDVRRWSFSDFISRLVSRFSTQPVAYLYVSSAPERAAITINGQRKSEVTNRRFVISVGQHQVVVARPSGACKETVTVEPFATGVVACGQ